MATVRHGKGATECGPGVRISMSGEDVASAISLWLYAQDILIEGPRTITYNNKLLEDDCEVYVDPSGCVLKDGVRFNGSGGTE
jgi:hypothetical protein